ncbi:aminotransferase class IV [Microlunatus flavus]|uniref:Branched-chain amino acid aminotransferase n=1 Tax=Microlunatus flavus TaxID=1036181 RepID=A0A1H9GAC1_9ACTN|nr:aminotransferase class IV [Microlunatus flavus]SEQ46953.1 branched-chain amino acid aminotransferase [Microlunatus flavus]
MQLDRDASATEVGTRPTVWIDGHLYADARDARVGATDHGLVVGDGVFEALKVTPEGPFALRRHLDRLERSAVAMGLPTPDRDAIRDGVDAVLGDRTFAHGKIRITYTGGDGPLGSQAAYGVPTLVVAAAATDHPPASTDVVTAPWRRNEHGALTGVKSTSYGENVRGLAFARAHGCGETIFLNTAGDVCEGTGTNVFCVFGREVVTPPLSAGSLAGITRELLLEWVDVTERDLTLEEALSADEVFLTSSLRDVQLVERWDSRAFTGLGAVTAGLAGLFAERSGADLDP